MTITIPGRCGPLAERVPIRMTLSELDSMAYRQNMARSMSGQPTRPPRVPEVDE